MDCENCATPRLWECNYEAWIFYQRAANQFVYDFHALPLVFELYQPKLTLREARLLFEKLVIIHSALSKKQTTEPPEDTNGRQG